MFAVPLAASVDNVSGNADARATASLISYVVPSNVLIFEISATKSPFPLFSAWRDQLTLTVPCVPVKVGLVVIADCTPVAIGALSKLGSSTTVGVFGVKLPSSQLIVNVSLPPFCIPT